MKKIKFPLVMITVLLFTGFFSLQCLAFHKYLFWNPGFEDDMGGWYLYDSNKVSAQTAPSPVPDGTKAARFRVSTGSAWFAQSKDIGTDYADPKIGQTVKAKAKIWIDPSIEITSKWLAFYVSSVTSLNEKTTVAKYIINSQNPVDKGKWILIETSIVGDGKIKPDAAKIDVVFEDFYTHPSANIYIDWVEVGTTDSPAAPLSVTHPYSIWNASFEKTPPDLAGWDKYPKGTTKTSLTLLKKKEHEKSVEMANTGSGGISIVQSYPVTEKYLEPKINDKIMGGAWIYIPGATNFGSSGYFQSRIEAINSNNQKICDVARCDDIKYYTQRDLWVYADLTSIGSGTIPANSTKLQIVFESVDINGPIYVDMVHLGADAVPDDPALFHYNYEFGNLDFEEGALIDHGWYVYDMDENGPAFVWLSILSHSGYPVGLYSATLYNENNSNVALYYPKTLGPGFMEPQTGQRVKAKAWVHINSDVDMYSGYFVMKIVAYPSEKIIALYDNISISLPRNRWICIETDPYGDELIPSGSTTISLSFESSLNGTICIDDIEIGPMEKPSDPEELPLYYNFFNTGFETGNLSAWEKHEEEAEVSICNNAYKGSYGLEMETKFAGRWNAAVWQAINVDGGSLSPKRGDKVRAIAKLKNNAIFGIPDPVPDCYLCMRIESVDAWNNKTTIAQFDLSNRAPYDEWIYMVTRSNLDDPTCSFPGIIPYDAVKLQIAIESRLIGSVSIDNIQVGLAEERDIPSVTYAYTPEGDLDFEDSFERSTHSESTNWGCAPYPNEIYRTVEQSTAQSKNGSRSVKLFRGTDVQVRGSGTVVAFWQEIPLETGAGDPKKGHKVEGGIWVYITSDCDLSKTDGYFRASIDSVYMDGSTKKNIRIANTYELTPVMPKNKWVFLEFYPINGGEILSNAFEIVIAIETTYPGTIYVDNIQLGYNYEAPAPTAIPAQYSLTNISFEDGVSSPWLNNASGSNIITSYITEGYYGTKACKMHEASGTLSLWQDKAIGSGAKDPKVGDSAEAGAWVKIDSSTVFGSFALKLISVNSSQQEILLAQNNSLSSSSPKNQWVYIKTPVATIPTGTVKIRIRLESSVYGDMFVDFVQAGVAGSINGNPEKYAIGEFHPWYGNAENDWYNWKFIQYEDKTEYVIHDPNIVENGLRNIASAYYPIIGAYDSADSNVIAYQVNLAKDMLIDCLLVNYYGDPSINTYGENGKKNQRYSDYYNIFDSLLTEAEAEGLKICVLFEPKIHFDGTVYYASPNNKREDRIQGIVEDIRSVCSAWGTRKGYLHYNSKPVIAIFGMTYYDLTATEWQQINNDVETGDPAYSIYLIGDVVLGGKDLSTYYPVFGGMMNWDFRAVHLANYFNISGQINPNPAYIKNYNPTETTVLDYSIYMNNKARQWASQNPGDRHSISIVWPGFDDSGVLGWTYNKDGDNTYKTPFWNGTFYTKTQQGAISSGSNWVIIATINDWNEGTQIEPSLENSYLYCIKTQNFLEDFKGVPEKEDDLMEKTTNNYLMTKETEVPMDLLPGWHMISLPVMPNPDKATLNDLFPKDVIMYKFQKKMGYVRVARDENLDVGMGYWILSNILQPHFIRGSAIRKYTIPVENGWYMIGGCTSPAYKTVKNGKYDVIYCLNKEKGYIRIPNTELLERGKGYWILFSDTTVGAEFRASILPSQ